MDDQCHCSTERVVGAPSEENWVRDFAMDNAPDGVVLADPTLSVVWANPAVTKLLDYDLHEELGTNIVEFVHPEDLDQALGAVAEATRKRGNHHVATRIRLMRSDGDYLDCRVTANTIERNDGTWFVLGVRSVGEEDAIESRRRRLRGLATTFYVDCASMEWVEEREHSAALLAELAAVLDADAVDVSEVGPDLSLTSLAHWTRRASTTAFGLTTTALTPELVQAVRDVPCEYLNDGDGISVRVWITSHNGHDGIVTVRFREDDSQWDDANADMISLMCSSLIATVRRCRRERELAMAATRDPLTGLLNRAALEDGLEELLVQSRRGGGELAVFFADLNNLKYLNDSMGHQAGDDALRRVADGLQRCIRSGDLAARLGGDEFVVVMLTRHRTIERLEARLREAVERSVADFDGVGVAIGSIWVQPGETWRQVLERADREMYADKRRLKVGR